MAFVVRLLLLAAVAALGSAVPCANSVASDEAATTEGDITPAAEAATTTEGIVALATDAAATTEGEELATTVSDAGTAVTEVDGLVTTDDPGTESPTPPRPVAFVPTQDDDSSASSSSEESSESSEDSKTSGPETSTADVGTEGPVDTTPSALKLGGNLSDDDEEDLFADVKERYAVPGVRLRKHRCPGVLNGRTVGGVCLDKGECLLKRGAKAGPCGLLGSCCYFQHTCGDVAHYKVSHFTNPQNIPSDCDLRINVYNRDVCQIRVDFEEFSLAQPERDVSPDDVELLGGYRCLRDHFTVEAPSARNLGFDALCGENRGQHIYIPVNATHGGTAVRLNFHVSNRSDPMSGLLTPARWLLRITQLECAAAEYDYSSIHAALASAGYQAVNRHVLGATDADLLAPQGCLQYYPQRSGTYMSFNYPARPMRKYLADLHYAICFRRRPGDCGIRHTVVGEFLIDFNAYTSTSQPYTDRNCDRRDPSSTYNYTGDDYLYVPNGVASPGSQAYTGGPLASKFCGLSVQEGDTITTTAAGPFHVYFHSDGFTFRSHMSDEGFQMRYDVLSGSCRLNDPGTSEVIR